MRSDDQVLALALAQGSLDLGLAHVRPERLNLERHEVFAEASCLVLPVGHSHAATREVVLLDLADEPMVAFSRAHAPIVFDAFIAICSAAGFSHEIKHSARSPFTIFQMVRMASACRWSPSPTAKAPTPAWCSATCRPQPSGKCGSKFCGTSAWAASSSARWRELVPKLATALLKPPAP